MLSFQPGSLFDEGAGPKIRTTLDHQPVGSPAVWLSITRIPPALRIGRTSRHTRS